MPITKMQDVVEELLGIGDRFDQALLEHETQLESENRQRQQRRQKFLGSDLGNAD